MGIKGIENMTISQLNSELSDGGKFVVYEYCISLLIMTFKRSSNVYYIKPGENAFVKSIPYTAISLIIGWWGIPWGPIYTLTSTFTNICGGKDVTKVIISSINTRVVAQQNSPPPVVDWYKE
jgi:hypothetical protein